MSDTKWTAKDLGPRQAKAFNEAVSAFGWEAKTKTEITDFGQHSYVEMFGGSWQPGAAETLTAIRKKYNSTVTSENYRDIIGEIQAATVKLKDTRPVIDKRSTPEERAEREEITRANREAEAKRNEERAEFRRVWDSILTRKPSGANALIVAEQEENASDIQSDYFNSRTVRRVAIGWRMGKREDFRQLRATAAKFPETAHLGPDADASVEHRDNYSMGHGNWVGQSRYSGWQVRSIDLSYEHAFPGMIEDGIPVSTAEGSAPLQSGAVEGVTVTENEEKDGVEIRFPAKPDRATLDALKARGWRWSRFSSCWYHRRDADSLAFAYGLAGQVSEHAA